MIIPQLRASLRLSVSATALAALLLASTPLHAGWGTAPAGWGDFQMGVVNNTRTHWDTPMRAALTAGVEFDRRYTYATQPSEVMGPTAFLFTASSNYFTDAPFSTSGVRGTMTIYMVQKGADGLDAVKAGCADQAFMTSYFNAIIHMVQKGIGAQPIYVIEPDVWSYLLQNFESTQGAANVGALCHINDLGIANLAEFGNTIGDLPRAIIKTIKTLDPAAYAGILMAHWSYGLQDIGVWGPMINMTAPNVLLSAQGAANFANALLGSTWRGDFIGVEKNGADAGWWRTTYGQGSAYDTRYWTETQNTNWLNWSKELGQKMDLPLLGWQICLGYDNSNLPAGYSALPNTNNRYEDTFFPFFFNHVGDFMSAGFIGMMAGCNNQDAGTTATMTNGTGDNGYFYNSLTAFNAGRPYISSWGEPTAIAKPDSRNAGISGGAGSLSLRGQFAGDLIQLDWSIPSAIGMTHASGAVGLARGAVGTAPADARWTSPLRLRLLDATGTELRSTSLSAEAVRSGRGRAEWSAAHLPRGLYFATLQGEGVAVATPLLRN